MTCDVKHTMVKSKALSNPPNPLQILGSSTGFKNQFSSEKTYSYKLDLKTRFRELRRLVSLYLHTKFKTTGSPNFKIIIFIRKVVLAFASKDFPKQLFGFHIEGIFFQSISQFFCDFGPI